LFSATLPHAPTQIVDEKDEVFVAAWCSWCHRPTEVIVQELQLELHTVPHLTRKREMLLLAHQAAVADLINMIDQRQALNHPFISKLLEAIKV
jgi:hypothetical protein